MSLSSRGGDSFSMSLIDEFSGYGAVKFAIFKTQALQAFNEFFEQYCQLKSLRSVNVLEATQKQNEDFKKNALKRKQLLNS